MTQPCKVPDPLETSLIGADDRIRLSTWLPPQTGVAPRIRVGRRWINVLWAMPLAVVLLILRIPRPTVAHDARSTGIRRALPQVSRRLRGRL